MFIRSLQFRTEIVIYSFLDVLPFFVLFFVWSAIYQNSGEINNFSLAQIINYYLLVIVIQRLSATHFEGWRSEEIRNGKIDYYLIRPLSYISEILSKDIGAKLISIAFSAPMIILFYVINVQIFQIDHSYLTLNNIVTFLGLMLLAYSIQFLFALWIVLLTFWFEGSSGLEHFKWVVLTLFSGAMIPVEFMPNWLANITNALPLKYVFAVPIGVLQNTYTLQSSDFAYIGAVLVIMIVFTQQLWNQAKKVYGSVGG